jgi:adenosylhomocysteine nucleosidase
MKILVLSAFENELLHFMHHFPAKKEIAFSNRKCWHARLGNADIYFSCTGLGLMHAGITATLLCEILDPSLLILCGSAGGLRAGQRVGDIVVGESVVDIDFVRQQEILAQSVFEPCLWDYHTSRPHAQLFQTPSELMDVCLDSTLPGISRGRIATSNAFPAPREMFERIKRLGCSAIEMEGAAVLNAVKYYGIPAVVVRAISNALDESGNDLGAPDDALETCSARLSLYLLDLLPRLAAVDRVFSPQQQLWPASAPAPGFS